MIKKLSDRLIKQIAAGEVISKPYNAVKELIENAIDSGASNIQIYFQEYGMKSIIILDNGSGINKEDLILATQLHTTSKTTESDSMFGINNFGFRGEALASIDAISNLIIESNGYKIENQIITESTMKKGTKVTVKNLFQNVPARLKFIKNPQFEFKLIKELIKKFMIQHNQINWTVSLNEKYIWDLKEDTKEKRIKNLYKEEHLVEMANNENTTIKAFILKNQANIAIIFVNKRSIKDKSIVKYISSLYKEYTFIHENPGYILDITINPIFVDYNVHPAKEEVKFMNYTMIFELLHSIFSMDKLAPKINNENIIFSDHSIQNIKQEQSKVTYTSPILEKLNKYNSNFLRESDDLDIFLNKTKIKTSQITIKPLFKIIGQLQNAYILFENEQGLGIFDQHAAHERQIYEKLKNGLTQNASQKLLTPIKLKLSNEAQLFIEESIRNLELKGIYIENTEIISLPILFKNITELVDLIQNLQPPCDINTEIDRLLANIACKNALKANTTLSIYQMQTLLEVALINPPICNHGRPVFKYFSNNEIKNFFKRT